jgi:hypothetical protein
MLIKRVEKKNAHVTATCKTSHIKHRHRMDKMSKYHTCRVLFHHQMQRIINFCAVFNSLATCTSLLASLSNGTLPDDFDTVIHTVATQAGVGIRNVGLYIACHPLTSLLSSITTVSNG